MTDFFNPPITRKAKKAHRCTYCGEKINQNDLYIFQKGVYDGCWYESKMHPECWDDFVETGGGEYTPYSNERPKKEQ